MTLFVPPGSFEQASLPLAVAEQAPTSTPSPLPTGQATLLAQSIALVTALLPTADGAAAVVPALLAEQDADQLLGLTATTAWRASALVTLVDTHTDGGGTTWLRALALSLAEQP